MKFYYNNKLVRTSKNHHYTHAWKWRDSEKVLGCNANRELAQKAKDSYISFYFSYDYKFYTAMMEAKKQGKTKFYWNSKYASTNWRNVEDDCEEKFQKAKERYDKAVNDIIIVELEER